MGKVVSDKIHSGIRREVRPNGDIYVYERITKYDPERKQTVTISEHLQGKIKSGTTKLVPTRFKRKKGEKVSSIVASRVHSGLEDILNWVGKESGIDADIYNSFSKGEADKILSIARYWVATDGNVLTRLESWQTMHNLPYPNGISEDVYGALFHSIGLNESSIQQYFVNRAAKLDKKPVLALDSTTISTYSTHQPEARCGFNKDNDGLNTIKLVTLYSVKDHEPIAFTKQPGNIPDVISVENAISQLCVLDIDKALIVTDAGYRSENNILEYAQKHIKFLTVMDANSVWIKKIIDEVQSKIMNMSCICPFDPTIRGIGTSVMHTFSYSRKKTRGKISAGNNEEINHRLYVNVFYSPERAVIREMELNQTIIELKNQVESGCTDFTDAARRRIEKYLMISHVGRGGKLHVNFNDENILKAKKYLGYFALVSNQKIPVFTSLEYYRLREKIEELFGVQKGSFDGRRPRVWSPDKLRGRQFVQFVGLGYRCFLQKKIKELQEKLAIDDENKTEGQRNREIKLAKWIESHSFAQIMDWFDCIETTKVQTENSKLRWSSETTIQDNMFLSMLGVLKK